MLQRHQLNDTFLETTATWFDPLARKLAASCRHTKRAHVVAINGCQGSGKTTVSDYLRNCLIEVHGINAVVLCLDDFYLTIPQRKRLAQTAHPLFATRGVPGTHDMQLLHDTLRAVQCAAPGNQVAIPRFNKVSDDRFPEAAWSSVSAPINIVLLEGWCLGAQPQSASRLSTPVNALEREEDSAGLWRNFSNAILRSEFQSLYEQVDEWMMLRAPSFECVLSWRQEQEKKLANTIPKPDRRQLMDRAALGRFIQHYERITTDCLRDLPATVHHLFSLNSKRRVISYTHRPDAKGPHL